MKRLRRGITEYWDFVLTIMGAGAVVIGVALHRVNTDAASAAGLAVFLALVGILLRDRLGRNQNTERVIGWIKTIGSQQESQVIPSDKIHETFLDTLKGADDWHFRGGRGRFLRSVTLPAIESRAREKSATCIVRIEMMDPRQLAICETYVDHWKRFDKLQNSRAAIDDARSLRRDLVATILVTSWFYHHSLLDIRLVFSREIPVIRYDEGADALLITSPDHRSAAVRVAKGSLLYTAYHDDLLLSFERAEAIALKGAPKPPTDIKRTTDAQVRALVDWLKVDTPFEAREYEAIRKLSRQGDPYP